MIDWEWSTKRDLMDYADKCNAVESMREQIAEIDAELTGVGSALKGDTPVKGGGEVSDKWLNMLIKRAELEQSLASTDARVRRIAKGMAGLSKDEQTLLDRAYIHHISHNNICALMNLESAQVYRLEKKALRRLALRMYGDAVR